MPRIEPTPQNMNVARLQTRDAIASPLVLGPGGAATYWYGGGGGGAGTAGGTAEVAGVGGPGAAGGSGGTVMGRRYDAERTSSWIGVPLRGFHKRGAHLRDRLG